MHVSRRHRRHTCRFIFMHQIASMFFIGQMGDLTNAPARLNGTLQQEQTLDIGIRIAAAVGLGAHRFNRLVALFPHPDHMRAQSSSTHDDFNGVTLIHVY